MLEIQDISKSYISENKSIHLAIKNLSLALSVGEFVSIVGSSGSGKSTLLNIIAGLADPSEGSLIWTKNGDKRRVGYVFQDSTVFPWKTVIENLQFTLNLSSTSVEVKPMSAQEYLNDVGLSPEKYQDKYPKELSGGELRRLAIAMALANKSDLFLLDEPTSSLDDYNKLRIQGLIQDTLSKDESKTILLVTHDIEEAVFLSSRILVMGNGSLIADIPVDQARPRQEGFRTSKELRLIKDKVLNYMESSIDG